MENKIETMKLFFPAVFAFIKIQFLPALDLLTILFLCMVFDFVTGIWKAKTKNQVRTSDGFRKTISKFVQYIGAIIGGAVLAYIGEQKGGEHASQLFGWFNDGLVTFIIYIEITSIFENLYAIDPRSKISQFCFQPAIKLLTFQFKNNPIVQQAEAKKDEIIKS